MFPRNAPLALLAAALLLAGCGKTEIASYRVPKEKDPELPAAAPGNATGAATPPPADMASTPVTTATGEALTWTAPAHWKAKPASAMRKGSYSIAGEGGVTADVSITAFPGSVGGELANLNRWRDQLRLPPITENELPAATTHLDLNGLHMTTVDITAAGASPQRVLGAMIPHGDATWFVKVTGPEALLAKEKAAFRGFLETIKAAPDPTPAR